MADRKEVSAEMNRRWEQGIAHDSRSVAVLELLMAADVIDYFDWKKGGDGDNGEILMYGLDVHFASTNCIDSVMLTRGG